MADALEHGGGAETAAPESLAPGPEAPAEAAPEAQTEGRKPGARKPTSRASAPAVRGSIRVKQHPPKPRDPERIAEARKRKEARDNAAQSAVVLLAVLDGAVSMSLGDECKMTEAERRTMEKPLQRIIERLDPETNEAVSQYADPILLILGLFAWGVRIWRVTSARDDGDDHPRRDYEPPVEPVPPDDIGLGPEDELPGGNHREPVITRIPDPAEIRSQLGGMGSVLG